MTQYFIHDGQNEKGPFDLEQLKEQSLTKDTPIWHEGLEQWTTAGNVEQLKELFSSKTTPPPLTRVSEEVKPPSFAKAYSEDVLPTKKKNKLIPLIVGGVLIVGGIIAWLVYQNNQNSGTIDNLQTQVNTQQDEGAQKEAERQKINTATTEKNMKYRNNWSDYIKVQNDDPSVNYTLGGISPFTVYVTNQTDYLLDQVDITINYIRKNGDSWQTKTVSIFNVPSNSNETGTAPESINGVKVNVTITKIISKKMHFCYPADNGNTADPYFCK